MNEYIRQYIETAERFSVALQLEVMAEQRVVRVTSQIEPVKSFLEAMIVRANSDNERIWSEHDSARDALFDLQLKRRSLRNELDGINYEAAAEVKACGGDATIVLKCTEASKRHVDRFQAVWSG